MSKMKVKVKAILRLKFGISLIRISKTIASIKLLEFIMTSC